MNKFTSNVILKVLYGFNISFLNSDRVRNPVRVILDLLKISKQFIFSIKKTNHETTYY
jgi:hypothetical protein